MTKDRPAVSVLIVDLSRRFGGADVRVINTIRGLRDPHRYLLVTASGSGVTKRLGEPTAANVHQLAYHKLDPRNALAIYKLLRKGDYQAIDCHNPQSLLWGVMAAVLARVPIKICTVHSAYRESERGLMGILYEAVLFGARLSGCRFVAVSDSVKHYLCRLGIREQRVRVIENALAVDEYHRSQVAAAIKKEFRWPQDCFLATSVGRLEAAKGHADLIEAVGLLHVRNKKIRCLIVGEGDIRPELESRVRRLGLTKTIQFAGFRNDIQVILNGSDLFCLPSLTEGLPYALLEACACRLPCVVTQVSALVDFFADSDAVVYVAPGNPQQIASKLERFLDQPALCAEYGDRGHQFIHQRLSYERMIEQTLDSYGGA